MRGLVLTLLLATPAAADPLSGKSFIIEMSSSQAASGYGDYLLPPLMKALDHSDLKPWTSLGPGADVVVNVVTESDVGRWVKTDAGRVWIYTIAVTIGISPEGYVIPFEGTPAYGVRAVLETPNPDRQDKMDCLDHPRHPHGAGELPAHRHPENRRIVLSPALKRPFQRVNGKSQVVDM